MKDEVFISYAWGASDKEKQNSSQLIDSITKALSQDFNVIIDKKTVKYKDNIKEFEKRLGKGSKIVLLISDRFLKSKHCMYEVLKIQEKGDVYDRIYPVVMPDADIYTSKGPLKYLTYWENEIEELNDEIKKLKSSAYTKPIQTEITVFTEFRKIIADFIHILSNMNTLNLDSHKESNFRDLITALHGGNPPISNPQLERAFENNLIKTKNLFENAVKLISTEINTGNAKADEILEKVKHFQRLCENQTFQIAVMAVLKSGKSTFLNALLGNEYLPMSNVAETSVPVKINHSTDSKGTLIFERNTITGANDIRKHIEETNREKREKGFKYEVEFNLHAPFIALQEKEMTDVKFEILDTPGFGEALIEITAGKSIDQSNSELIDKISAIIYLLDYTKLKTKGEDEVLEKLMNLRSDIRERISDRMFFVINKIDEEDRNSLPPDKVIDYVFHLVKEKMPTVLRQHFFTISANRALLSRLILYGNATPEAKIDFGKIAFGFRANEKDEEEYRELAKEILLSSRITEIENDIINHIFENRSRIFLESLQDNLKRLLQEFRNKFVTTAEGVLNRTIEEIEELEDKIEEAKKKQKNIQEEADKFEDEIKSWNEKEFKAFEKAITDQIDSAFNLDKAEEKRSLFGKIIPNWVRRIHDFLTQVEQQSPHSSKEEIETLVRSLNVEINEELSKSFAEFRTTLEGKLVRKQSQLFSSLKQTINTLAKDFESTLKKTLQIELIPLEVRFEEPDFDRTLSEADALLDRFVRTDLKWVNVPRQRRVYNPRANCFLGGNETITRYEQELFAENRVSKAGLEIFWKEIIDDRYKNAVGMTNRLLEKNIKKQIVSARNSFDSYVSDYLITVQEKKVKLSTSSKEEIADQLNHLRKLNEDIDSILSTLDMPIMAK